MTQPMVSVVMITYAHEKYIKQAIEGVLIQGCDFDVELIIADDCSPDHTESIVKSFSNHPKYSWIKYIKHTSNKGMMSNFIFALQQAKGKYIALCEGDDYWTDPDKLQKQVFFLEANPNYIGCSHISKVINFKETQYDETNFWQQYKGEKNLGLEEVVSIIVPFQTASFLFKSSMVKFFSIFNDKWDKAMSGDIILYTLSCKFGPIKFLDQEMSVYRVHYGGVTSRFSNGYHLRGLFNRYIMWVLLSTEFTCVKRKKYFNSVIKHYEYYIIKNSKKVPFSDLTNEILYFLKSNPINIYTKLVLIYKILKNKLIKVV